MLHIHVNITGNNVRVFLLCCFATLNYSWASLLANSYFKVTLLNSGASMSALYSILFFEIRIASKC